MEIRLRIRSGSRKSRASCPNAGEKVTAKFVPRVERQQREREPRPIVNQIKDPRAGGKAIS